MRSVTRFVLMVATAAGCAASGAAQDGSVVGIANGQAGGARVVQPPRGPVSLTLERKSVQTLSDGTHITHVTRESFVRDRQGRTRTENEFGAMPGAGVYGRTVNVNDSVAGISYNWQEGLPGGRKVYTSHQRQTSANTMLRTLPDANKAPTGKNGSSVPVQSAAGVHVGATLQTGSSGTTPPPVVPMTGTASAASGMPPNPAGQTMRPETTRDPLGQRIVGGLTCMAQRITTVYPTDFFGNDRPITTMDETCMSQDAGRVIEETREDPRSGVQTLTLISGSLDDPDPSLFRPPPDYEEQKPFVPGQAQR